MVKIVDSIDLNEVYKELADPAAGGTCVFLGTVRNHSKGNEVTALSRFIAVMVSGVYEI